MGLLVVDLAGRLTRSARYVESAARKQPHWPGERVEGIEFISTTDILREQMTRGVQVYYTYDQHWTRWGHLAVAQIVSRYLSRGDAKPGPSSGSSPTNRATRRSG